MSAPPEPIRNPDESQRPLTAHVISDADEALLLGRLRGWLDTDEELELDWRLLTEDDLAVRYLEMAQEEATLTRWSRAAEEAGDPLVTVMDEDPFACLAPNPRQRRWRARVAILARLGFAALVVWVLAVSLRLMLRPTPLGEPIGVITRNEGAAWEDPGQPGLQAPVHVHQRLRLKEGLVEVALESGLRVILEGACDVTFRSEREAFLANGVVAVDAPRGVTGFTVLTRRATVVDRGTQFAVGIDSTGAMRVEVLEGAVDTIVPRMMAESKTVRATGGAAVSLPVDSSEPRLVFGRSERLQFVRRALRQSVALASDDHYIRGGDGKPHVQQDPGPDGEYFVLKSDIRAAPDPRRRYDADRVRRKAYVRFDLAGLGPDPEGPATFSFFVLKPLKIYRSMDGRIAVYGLRGGYYSGPARLGTDWRETELTWFNAPANDVESAVRFTPEAYRLAEVAFNQTDPLVKRQMTVHVARLGDFLQDDGSVTLMLALAMQSEKGAQLPIAASEHPSVPGPRLWYTPLRAARR